MNIIILEIAIFIIIISIYSFVIEEIPSCNNLNDTTTSDRFGKPDYTAKMDENGAIKFIYSNGDIAIEYKDRSIKRFNKDGDLIYQETYDERMKRLNSEFEEHLQSCTRHAKLMINKDGSSVTRYSNGNVQIKDKDGNIKMLDKDGNEKEIEYIDICVNGRKGRIAKEKK